MIKWQDRPAKHFPNDCYPFKINCRKQLQLLHSFKTQVSNQKSVTGQHNQFSCLIGFSDSWDKNLLFHFCFSTAVYWNLYKWCNLPHEFEVDYRASNMDAAAKKLNSDKMWNMVTMSTALNNGQKSVVAFDVTVKLTCWTITFIKSYFLFDICVKFCCQSDLDF